MKATELIKALQELIPVHGDMDIYVINPHYKHDDTIEGIEVLTEGILPFNRAYSNPETREQMDIQILIV